MKILYAEDDAEIRHLTVETLTRGGFNVVIARDGNEAWEKYLGGEEYDLILLNNYMPEKTGMQILEEIRERGDNILVVMLTSLIFPEMQTLADACIEKNWNFEKLTRDLKYIIAKGRKPIPPKKKTFWEKIFGKKK